MNNSGNSVSDVDLLRVLAEVLPEHLGVDRIQRDASLQHDLGIDSLGKVAAGFRLEELYGIDLTEFAMDLTEIRTVGDYLDIAHRLLAVANRK